jgi:predicted metallo-beta-lactamase superfamily hydrolase
LRLESTFGSPDDPAFQFVSTHPARLVLEPTPREWKRLRQVSGTPATA